VGSDWASFAKEQAWHNPPEMPGFLPVLLLSDEKLTEL
jgi:hypothetical protein